MDISENSTDLKEPYNRGKLKNLEPYISQFRR